MATLSNIVAFWSSLCWILFLITATYLAIFYLVYVRQTKRWKQSNIPYLQPTFLIGHKYFLKARKYNLAVSFDQLFRENKDKKLFGVFMGPMPIILLKDQKLIQQVLVKNPSLSFSTGFATPEFEVEAQHSIILSANEEKWKLARAALTPVFSTSWFQGAKFEKINEAIHELRYQIESEGCQLNVIEITQNFVFHIMATSFGAESNRPQINDNLREISEIVFECTLSRLFSVISVTYFPFLQRFKPLKFLPRKICNIMSDMLKQQFKLRDQMESEKSDLIDVLRSFRDNIESRNNGDKDLPSHSIDKDITMRKITGLALLLVLAGSETIYSLAYYAIHTLSLYPEHQRRIRSEIQATMKKHRVLELNYDVVQDLSFTFQCLYEVARLYPAGQQIVRRCKEDFHIPDTNYTLRKGDTLILPLYSVARDETLFKDPHLFDPERFDSKNSSMQIPAALLSFGAGTRKCPGYRHGLIVAASIVASIVYKYDIKPNSHLKLMDATDFEPAGFTNVPRKKIIVDLVQTASLDKN